MVVVMECLPFFLGAVASGYLVTVLDDFVSVVMIIAGGDVVDVVTLSSATPAVLR